MKPIKKELPRIPKQLILADFDEIEDEAFYENCLFENCTLSNHQLDKVCFKHSRFINVTFENMTFHQLELLDVEFHKCNISNTEMIGIILHRSLLKGSKFVGCNFSEGMVLDTSFEDCFGNYSFFSYTTFKRVVFEATSLIESDFFEVKWQKLQFDQCNLDGANFMNTDLRGLDFSTSTFEKIALSFDLLKGCTINPQQSLVLVAALGVNIS